MLEVLIPELDRQLKNNPAGCERLFGALEGIDLTIAVNLSPHSLLDTELPGQVDSLLRKWNLPPKSLQLEITEGSLTGDSVRSSCFWTLTSGASVHGVEMADALVLRAVHRI